DRVGEDQPGLEEVDIAVKLEMARREEVSIQAQQFPLIRRKQPLVPKTVNREHGAHGRESRIQLGLDLEKSNRQAGLPIVRVKYVRSSDLAEHFQNAAREEDESLGVVRVIAVPRAIQRRPVEIAVRFDEKDRNVSAHIRG